MPSAPIPTDETSRIQMLHNLRVLDTAPEEEFNALVKIASMVCDVPIALISLVDIDRQWFKANIGLEGVIETPRDAAFCAHAILDDDILEINDAQQDPRFIDNPLVTGTPDIRFYAGAPLRMPNGSRIGTLCVIDRQPRQLTVHQRDVLDQLAIAATKALQNRQNMSASLRLLDAESHATSLLENSVDAIITVALDGAITNWNRAAIKLFGYTTEECIGQQIDTLLFQNSEENHHHFIEELRSKPTGLIYETLRRHQDGTLIPVLVSVGAIFNAQGMLSGTTKIIRDMRDSITRAKRVSDSEERFRALSESSPLGVYATDAKGNCTYTNSRWQKIYGLTLEQSLGDQWAMTIHPDDRATVFENWQSAADNRRDFNMEFRILQANGTLRHVHSLAQMTTDGHGETTGFVGSVEDITDRIATQKLLIESESRLLALYNSTPAMMHSADAKGNLISVSDLWLLSLGYTREEVIGRPYTDFLTEESRKYANTVLTDLHKQGYCNQIEYQMVTKEGKIIDALLSAVLESNVEGAPVCSMAIIEDVTVRNAALRSSNELLSVVRSQFIMSITNAAGEIIEVNDAFCDACQYQREELIGKNHRIIKSGYHSNEFFEDLWKTIKSGSPWHGEICNRAKDGSLYWVDCVIAPLIGSDRHIERYISIRRNVTSRKVQEESLRKSQSLLDRTGRIAGVGGWELDLISGELFWSDQTCRIHDVELGYKPRLSEAIDFYAPEARQTIQEAVATAISSSISYDLELPLVQKNGNRIWVRSIGACECVNGVPIRLVGAFQDVTTSREQRDAIADAKNTIELATESGEIGVWDYNLAEGTLKWDAWMHRLYGVKQTDELTAYDLWARHVHPEDKPDAERALQDAIISGHPFVEEFRIVWEDGTIHHIRSTARVTRNDEGKAVRMVGVNWDVTRLRELSSQLADQYELLSVTLNSIGDAVITTNALGEVNWLNPVAERLTGWVTADAKGLPLPQVFNIINEDTRQATENPIATCLAQGKIVGLANHTILISRHGDEYGIEDSAAPIINANGETLGAVLVFHDVTEQRRLSGEMTYRATHDALTGLVNRVEFETRLRQVLNKTHEDNSIHALMYIDLDQFKIVNDACGHSEGDKLLQQVTSLLAETVRSRDTLARLGGDEFAVILEQCSTEQALRVAQNICDRMDDFRFIHDSRRFRIGTSIGLVPIDARWSNTAAVLQAADTSCYAAKEAGRNRVHVWYDTDQAMRARHGEMAWTTTIEQALDENAFTLYAQHIVPLVEQSNGLHAEVLLRMVQKDGTLIQPTAFLPAAERFHLASRIDRWVLRHVIDWLLALPEKTHIDTLCVNLSGQSIGDRAFHRYAIETLNEAGTNICKLLCFEITETSAVTNMTDATHFIKQVRALGVRTALDDFGAGAASFGYLKTLPVDYLKIDGQFIKDLLNDRLDDAAVRCFADVAKTIGIKTVAEYVEEENVLARLKEIGIDYTQGFFLHKPEPLDNMRGEI